MTWFRSSKTEGFIVDINYNGKLRKIITSEADLVKTHSREMYFYLKKYLKLKKRKVGRTEIIEKYLIGNINNEFPDDE